MEGGDAWNLTVDVFDTSNEEDIFDVQKIDLKIQLCVATPKIIFVYKTIMDMLVSRRK